MNSQHADIQVAGIRLVGKSHLLELAEEKLKAYRALVWTEKELTPADLEYLNSLERVVLQQKTPIRVLHRRSLITREKQILKMQADSLSENTFELKLVSSGGTYIKEFVHGDLNRTIPNIGALLNTRSDILELDVLGLSSSLEELLPLLHQHYK